MKVAKFIHSFIVITFDTRAQDLQSTLTRDELYLCTCLLSSTHEFHALKHTVNYEKSAFQLFVMIFHDIFFFPGVNCPTFLSEPDS